MTLLTLTILPLVHSTGSLHYSYAQIWCPTSRAHSITISVRLEEESSQSVLNVGKENYSE